MRCKKCGDIIIEPEDEPLVLFTSEMCAYCYTPPTRKDIDEAIKRVMEQYEGNKNK